MRVITRLNIGGPSHHALILTTGLNDAQFESRLLCGVVGPGEGDMMPEVVARGVPAVQIPWLRNHGGLIDAARTVWALFREFRRSRPQIVHLHQFKARLLGALAARAAGIPHIVQTYHGTLFERYFRPPLLTLLVILERCLGRWLTHHTIAVSEAIRRELIVRRVVPQDRVTVVPLGLDLRPFLEAAHHAGALRRELALPAAAAVIGFVGRLVPIKGPDVFLDAFAEVERGAVRPVHAVVIGDGPERGRLEAHARALAIGGCVSFLGWRRDLARLYADIDIFVLSSRNEGTPVAIIEATAAQRAIVATRVGGVPDVVRDGETGLLVEPDNPRALAGAIRQLLDDTALRERLALGAQAWVYPRYDAATLCATMRGYYLTIVGRVDPRRTGPRCAS